MEQSTKDEHWFVIHGLVFKSPFHLHGVQSLPPQADWDVEISFGSTPAYLSDSTYCVDWYEVTPEKILFVDKAIGSFVVENGESITIEKSRNASMDVLISYINASGVGAILHQRRLFPIHASCVAKNGSAFAFCGDSGVGKSTTATYLLSKGYELVCDDVMTIRYNDAGNALAVPSNRSPKIWSETADSLSLPDNKSLSVKEYQGTAKHIVQLNQQLSDSGTKSVLQKIFLLRWSFPQRAGMQATRLSGLDSINRLRENFFRGGLVESLDIQQESFIWSAKLLEQVEFISLVRGRGLPSLDCLESILDA